LVGILYDRTLLGKDLTGRPRPGDGVGEPVAQLARLQSLFGDFEG